MNINSLQLEIGDMIRIDGFGYQHVGIYIGGDSVIHNQKGCGVVQSSLREFAGGSEVHMHQKANGNYFDRQMIVRRASSLLGKTYDLINFNCEHAAYYAHSGRTSSPQLAGFAFIALVLGGFALLARSE